ncbi:unnamed protein product, partial [Mesorhabditis spiculigera]
MGTVIDALKNIEYAVNIAFDITSQIVKIAYVVKLSRNRTTLKGEVEKSETEATHINVIQLSSFEFDTALKCIAQKAGRLKHTEIPVMRNQGSAVLAAAITDVFGERAVEHYPNITAKVLGTTFLLKNVLDESFRYSRTDENPHYHFETINLEKSFLIAVLGTGLQIIRVASDGSYRRVRGNSLGTSTVLGLCKLLFDIEDLDEIITLAEQGDQEEMNQATDLNSALFSDPFDEIQPGAFSALACPHFVEKLRKNKHLKMDFCRTLLEMLVENIAQITVLSAWVKETVSTSTEWTEANRPARIFFDGPLIRNYPFVMRLLTERVEAISSGSMQAHFFRHQGFADVLGLLMLSSQNAEEKGKADTKDIWAESWEENIVGTSEFLSFVPKYTQVQLGQTTSLELICLDTKVALFPLIHPVRTYSPDTLDFQDDHVARQKWIDILCGTSEKMSQRATKSQGALPEVEKFLEQLRGCMQQLGEMPHAYGTSNARDLLDIREQLLREHGFDDIYLAQKALENRHSLRLLRSCLDGIDQVSDDRERLLKATRNFLAGNVFDWGAKEFVEMMQSPEGVTFERALELLKPRPWLIDDFDQFQTRIFDRKYKSAIIFCDNSGADFVLGALPFARELLKREIMVIMAVNKDPALNDVTIGEATAICDEAAKIDLLLRGKLAINELLLLHNGHGSPCLDLRRMSADINEAVLERQVDLVIFEGMGRALHTNLNAHLSVDCVKAAVIKNQWLAEYIGGEIFDSVFKLELADQN